MARTGEQIQQLGEQGAQRAKRWLESTCRAEVKWNNPTIGLKKLTFRKAGAPDDSEAQGDWFSFDLGGTFLGGDANGEVFLAECKKYAAAGDQGIEYRKFLAKCYRVESEHGAFHDRYLWVTWAPFSITSWPGLMTPAYVEESVTKDQERIRIALGDAAFDATVGTAVAEKLLIVVLSDGQEVLLSLHGDELMHVRKALLEFRSTA